MSFSNEVRNEIARIIPAKECCRKAELSAMLLSIGPQLKYQDENKPILQAIVSNAASARKIFKLLKQNYHLTPSVNIGRQRGFNKNRIFEVNTSFSPGQVWILEELGITDRGKINWKLVTRNCCKRAFIRGTFLCRGFINRPESEYHLELVLNDTKMASGIKKILKKYHLEAQMIERKSNIVLYIKESEKIVDFLRIIESHKGVLQFENVRILKSMRNQVNRQVNCETANLSKTINASLRQIEFIKELINSKGWEKLPQQIKELAILRIEHPDYTLKELGMMIDPPLSKSGVAYRMRKLEDLAEKINGQNPKV
ncbi:MAG: DNA-binding protein WhiA [Syntrophomonadaceae bacterium]|jgi:DNA-binding protein WhiA